MTDLQLAWVSGLFEGEGSISSQTHKDYTYPRVSLGMTDPDVVRKFAEYVGYGSITEYQPKSLKSDGSTWKKVYNWRIGKKSDVVDFLTQLLPYLGDRRAHKALDALDMIELQ